ncbi:hypothetical protein A2U01_0012255, partial [Trifolium medium]|nr:hypothetical protein [Trifolium medium]
KRTSTATTTSNPATTPDDNASKRPRRSSRGSTKSSMVRPLEVVTSNIPNDTESPAINDQASSCQKEVIKEDVNSRMNVIPDQAEVQLSNKSFQDQQSASLAHSNKSEPARSSNLSPPYDAEKTVSLGLVVDRAIGQIDKYPHNNQEVTSFDDATDVLSTIANFLDMTPSQFVAIFDSPTINSAIVDSLVQEIKVLYDKDPLTFPISEFESLSVLLETLEQNESTFDLECFQALKIFLERLRSVI